MGIPGAPRGPPAVMMSSLKGTQGQAGGQAGSGHTLLSHWLQGQRPRRHSDWPSLSHMSKCHPIPVAGKYRALIGQSWTTWLARSQPPSWGPRGWLTAERQGRCWTHKSHKSFSDPSTWIDPQQHRFYHPVLSGTRLCVNTDNVCIDIVFRF